MTCRRPTPGMLLQDADDLLFGKATALHALVLVLGQSEFQTGLGQRSNVRATAENVLGEPGSDLVVDTAKLKTYAKGGLPVSSLFRVAFVSKSCPSWRAWTGELDIWRERDGR